MFVACCCCCNQFTAFKGSLSREIPFNVNCFLFLQSVGQVHAEDADEGINGEIYYSLMNPKSSFAVDPVTGVITLARPLSYHKKAQHEVTIMAQVRKCQWLYFWHLMTRMTLMILMFFFSLQDRGAKSRFATRAPDTAKVHLSVRQVRVKKWKKPYFLLNEKKDL